MMLSSSSRKELEETAVCRMRSFVVVGSCSVPAGILNVTFTSVVERSFEDMVDWV